MPALPHLLVLNQYYRPGVEATGNLLAELCESLVEDYRVTVVTGRVRDHEDLPSDEVVNGVRVLRTRSTVFDRARLHLRAANYATYLADSVVRAFSIERPDLVLTLTDPPMIGDIGLAVARRAGVPLVVVSEDVFPEIAVELKRLENPALVGLLRFLVETYLRRADRIVAIGETMRRRLEEKGAPPERLRVIENWVDTTRITPQPRVNDWSRRHGLDEGFVVMHSGNVGHAQDVATLVRAATFLRDLEDVRIVVIGFGALHAETMELVNRLETTNVSFLGYQPREVLSQSLSAAHLHYLGLTKGLSGFVVPSRTYGILSAGRPVLVSADPECETVRMVQAAGCGIVVPPGRPDRVAGAIRDAYEGEHDLEEMGRRGREYVEREADRSVAIRRYRDVLAELVPASRSR
ncbi:MAG TPA: glycosyltransferase family 4 protein [Gaiellaceae bacterium]|nr:glycosyltransferase family 4 protein [Gaiellaceae bacterium]